MELATLKRGSEPLCEELQQYKKKQNITLFPSKKIKKNPILKLARIKRNNEKNNNTIFIIVDDDIPNCTNTPDNNMPNNDDAMQDIEPTCDNNEYGICCFCQDLCDPASQSCGKCPRNFYEWM